MSRSLRNLIFAAHKWVGLNGALFFGFMFVTGATLSLSEEIELLIHPEIRVSLTDRTSRASFGRIYDAVQAADPGAAIVFIELGDGTGLADQAHVNAPQGRIVYWADPNDGAILAVLPQKGFKSVLRNLHESLLVPSQLVYLAVTSTSIFLFYMILSGLITYRQFWLGLARLPQRDGDKRQRLGGWHRLIAVWVAPFLLLVAITGFYFFVEGLGYGGGAAAGPLTEERSAPLPVGFDGAKIDAAVAVSLNIQSDLVPNSFALPDSN